MAEHDHDDLADALSRLAGGDVVPSERDHDPVPPPPPPPVAPPARPAFRPTAPAAARPPGLRPPPPRPVAPPVAPPPVVAATPARPQRPATPTVSRPAAPPPPNLTPPADDGATADGAVVDDDDAVIVPAPDASVFVPKRKPGTTAEARARVARAKQLAFRQTLIPVLLNGGVLLVGFGLLPVLLGADSVAARLPGWVAPTLMAVGGLLLALAAANMVSVRGRLAADAAPVG